MTLSKWCRGLAAVSAVALASGCGWFGDDATPMGKARPGADRAVAPSSALPPPAGGAGVEAGIAPVDEVAPAIGSVIPGKGGQKAQKEAAEKEASERDAKARVQREERDAAEKAARAAEKAKGAAPASPDARAAPPAPPANSAEPVLPPIPPAQEPRG